MKIFFVYWYNKGKDEFNNEKIYYIECNKHRKFLNLKISSIFDKTLGLCTKWSKYKFKEEKSTKILKVLGFIDNIKWLYITLNAWSLQTTLTLKEKAE